MRPSREMEIFATFTARKCNTTIRMKYNLFSSFTHDSYRMLRMGVILDKIQSG